MFFHNIIGEVRKEFFSVPQKNQIESDAKMAKTYTEPARKIPIVDDVDIIIAGSGPAGIGAAWAAAKHNAKTLLIESANVIGGMIIPGMMSHWTGTSGSSVFHEILERAYQAQWPNENVNSQSKHYINHEKEKLILLEMLQEVGVKIQLRTNIVDVIKKDNQLNGIITESKSGREAILCKTIIDCTGDGDIAAFAGIPFAIGREEDQGMQPATLMFKIGGVDPKTAVYPGSFESLVDTPKGELQALAKKILPKPAGHVLLYRSTIPGIVVVNMTNVTNVNGTDVRSISNAEIICAKQIPVIMDFLHEYVPGYEKAYVLSTAANVGIRETRHIQGCYTMTAEDIVSGKTFQDWIATKCFFNFDIHNIAGAGLDAHGAQKKFHADGTYTIPYRCCLPQRMDGLLVAGRAISGTHLAHSNYRAMPICTAIGQGCGTAAAVAIANRQQLRDVDIATVQKWLRDDGVQL